MPKTPKTLVLNFGSTSSKVAIYTGSDVEKSESISHPTDELKQFVTIWDQFEYRQEKVLKLLEEWNVDISDIDVISCRGGCIKPCPAGIYAINDKMIEDIKSQKYGIHPTGLGNIIAVNLSKKYNIPAITVDTPASDEFCPEARFSGLPQISRRSSFHVLNQKATARKVAAEMNKTYEEMNMVVAHLGGGISVGAHKQGKIIDANNALDGDGPFSPERAGTLPAADFARLCFSGEYTEPEVKKLVTNGGGLMGYLNTTDAREVESRIANGDSKAELVYNSMIYQVAKEIGACAAVLDGEVDAIALTGSLSYSDYVISRLTKKISFIAKVYVNPGENELQALAEGAVRFYNGTEKLLEY
ncbi:MAG: butyrate kinase [Pedobacter sp.]